jgi:RNA polymerase sigma-70 factor, ECF subfamily
MHLFSKIIVFVGRHDSGRFANFYGISQCRVDNSCSNNGIFTDGWFGCSPKSGKTILPMEVTTIYKQFHSALLRYVKSKVRSREDAEDILQNVFIRISANIGKLSEEVKLKNWIFTIARNAIIDYYRTNARTKKVSVSYEIEADIPEADDPDPTKGLDQCMDNMISLLPAEYRDIIIDSELKGIKQKDLAEKYGMAFPSMRSRVQRGRERLKQLFYNCCQIETDKHGNILAARGRADCDGPCQPCQAD